MSVQDEINKINDRITALNKDVQALVDELEGVIENEFPQDDDDYWFITDRGMVFSSKFENKKSERDSLEIGNIFQTEEQAEFAVEKLKVEAELRKYSRPFKGDGENHFIELCIFDKTLSLDYEDSFPSQGTIYFESKEKAIEAFTSVGVDRIKKYIFGVED